MMNIRIHGKMKNRPGLKEIRRELLAMCGPLHLKKKVTRKVSALTMENAIAFGMAASAGKLLRNAISPLLDGVKDASGHQRLIKKLMEVIMKNPSGVKSEGLKNGNLELLCGYDFNNKSYETARLFSGISATINRNAGYMTLSVPSFDAAIDIVAPKNATHYKLLSVGVGADFRKRTFDSDIQRTELLPLAARCTRPVTFIHEIGVEDSNTLLLVVAIKFYAICGIGLLPFKGRSFNPVRVVRVSNTVRGS